MEVKSDGQGEMAIYTWSHLTDGAWWQPQQHACLKKNILYIFFNIFKTL